MREKPDAVDTRLVRLSPDRLGREIERRCAEASGAVGALCEAEDVIQQAVPHDAWCVLTVDPATLLPTGGFHDHGVEARLIPRLVEIETANTDVLSLPALSRSAARAETLATATEGVLDRSERYRDVLRPSGLQHEVRVTFPADGHLWACLVLFREDGARDFSDSELELLVHGTRSVGTAVRRQLVLTEVVQGGEDADPGLILLGENLDREVATPAALRWLAGVEDGVDSRHDLPFAVTSLAGRVLASGSPCKSRLRTSEGRWLTLHADLVVEDRRRVSVIVEPSRPVEVAQIVADAYQLTPREREVVHYLATGYARAEVARALGLSPHTVDDHVKRVYAKLDVRSRAELTARLFFDQHAPRIADDVPVGGTGWFLR